MIVIPQVQETQVYLGGPDDDVVITQQSSVGEDRAVIIIPQPYVQAVMDAMEALILASPGERPKSFAYTGLEQCQAPDTVAKPIKPAKRRTYP